MATGVEIRTMQKAILYDLLKAAQREPESKELKELISKTEASMEQEDVAWVEKKAEMK